MGKGKVLKIFTNQLVKKVKIFLCKEKFCETKSTITSPTKSEGFCKRKKKLQFCANWQFDTSCIIKNLPLSKVMDTVLAHSTDHKMDGCLAIFSTVTNVKFARGCYILHWGHTPIKMKRTEAILVEKLCSRLDRWPSIVKKNHQVDKNFSKAKVR